MKQPEKIRFQSDRELGIRPMRVIEKLPVSDLNDSEIAKLFFKRFNANALVMIYVDKEGVQGVFGRLASGQKIVALYRNLIPIIGQLGEYISNWRRLHPGD